MKTPFDTKDLEKEIKKLDSKKYPMQDFGMKFRLKDQICKEDYEYLDALFKYGLDCMVKKEGILKERRRLKKEVEKVIDETWKAGKWSTIKMNRRGVDVEELKSRLFEEEQDK